MRDNRNSVRETVSSTFVARKYLSWIDSTATRKFVCIATQKRFPSAILSLSWKREKRKTCEDFGFIRIHFFPLEKRVAYTLLGGCVEKGRIP